MRRGIAVVVALLVVAPACSPGEAGTDPVPRASLPTGSDELPAAFATRLEAACKRALHFDRAAEDLTGAAKEKVVFRSIKVLRGVFHAEDVPPEAGTMVAAFDEYYMGVQKSIEILKRSDRLEPIMKEALESGDRDRFLQARNAFAAALDEAEALFKDAQLDYERFIIELRKFGLEECDRTTAP